MLRVFSMSTKEPLDNNTKELLERIPKKVQETFVYVQHSFRKQLILHASSSKIVFTLNLLKILIAGEVYQRLSVGLKKLFGKVPHTGIPRMSRMKPRATHG
jgi:hypothetical protein